MTPTLNSTNDFQVFGERFRNVARIAPAQAAYWRRPPTLRESAVPARGYCPDLRLS